MLWTQFLKTRPEVKVTVTQKWFVTLKHPKMHLHTKFGIPISKNIGDMHQFLETRSEVKFKVTVTDTSSSQDASTHQIADSYLKYYKRYALDMIILKTCQRSRSQ